MAIVPIVVKPYPDELLYSWVMRLAKLNELRFYIFVNAYFTGGKRHSKTDINFDIKNGFFNFYNSLMLNESADKLYLKLSTFSYECIGLNEAFQTRAINKVFYPGDRLNTNVNTFFSTLNVCPDCINEDIKNYGEPYYHRAHHLSGIYKCHKHGTTLRRYKKSFKGVDNFSLENYEELTPIGEDYSKFAYDLLNANLDIDINRIKTICNENNIKIPEKRIYGYSTGLILPSLYSLCNGDINVLKGLIKDNNNNSVIKKFNCDKCGNEYFTTLFGYNIGWRCPSCTSKQDEQTRFKSMVSLAGNNEYEVAEFKSMNERHLFKHSCGLENYIKPRSFLYEGVRCRCQKEILFNEAKEKIEHSGKFKLIEFTKAEEHITVKSLKCGHVFKVPYRGFIESESCRVCRPATMNNISFEYRVDNLTNGEFRFIGDYKDYKTRTTFLHTKCNKTFEATPADFLDRFYCPYCDSVFNDRWEQNYKLLCDYKDKNNLCDIPKNAFYKGSALGIWCQRQRDKFKEGILSDERVKKLQDIGFSFNPLEEEWERKYNQYKKYIKMTGSNEIHRRTMFEGERLGVWIFIQKKVYKEGKMSDYRMNKLLQLNKDIFD